MMIDWTKPVEVVHIDGKVSLAMVQLGEVMGSCHRVYELDTDNGPWWAEADTGEIQPGIGWVRNRAESITDELACTELSEQPTLRDRFAMAALTGFMASDGCFGVKNDPKIVWAIADAVLAARGDK